MPIQQLGGAGWPSSPSNQSASLLRSQGYTPMYTFSAFAVQVLISIELAISVPNNFCIGQFLYNKLNCI